MEMEEEEVKQPEQPQRAMHCDGCGQLIGYILLFKGMLKLTNGLAIRWPLTIVCVCGRNVRWKGEPLPRPA